MRAGCIQGRVIAQKVSNFSKKLREMGKMGQFLLYKMPYIEEMRVIIKGG